MRETKTPIFDLVLGRCPVSAVETPETNRLVSAFRQVWTDGPVHTWTCTQGLNQEQAEGDPAAILETIGSEETPNSIYILINFHHFFQGPAGIDVQQTFEDFHRPYFTESSFDGSRTSVRNGLVGKQVQVVLVSSVDPRPEELQHLIPIGDFPRPDRDTLLKVANRACQIYPEGDPASQIADNLAGLTLAQAKTAIRLQVQRDGKLRSSGIRDFKSHIISNDVESVSFLDPAYVMDDVGGMDLLGGYIDGVVACLKPEAREYGLDSPRGVGLAGEPGTGKSMVAEAIASEMDLPLVRFDPSAAKGEYVGNTERNTRRAIEVIEAIKPCVVQIDEVEKALPRGGALDGGASSGQLGSLLTYMSESEGVYWIMTSNNPQNLPPELCRAGRLNRWFHVGLPGEAGRNQIARIHLWKRRTEANGIETENFDFKKISKATVGFSGAEIEEAVKQAMTYAFMDGGRTPTTKDVTEAVDNIVPLSEGRAEDIKAMASWASKMAFPASSECGKAKKKKKSGKLNKLKEEFGISADEIDL